MLRVINRGAVSPPRLDLLDIGSGNPHQRGARVSEGVWCGPVETRLGDG